MAGVSVLFLTTYPHTDRPTWNVELHHELRRRGVKSTLLSWRNPPLTISRVCDFSHVLFLTCSRYVDVIAQFQFFIHNVLIPAQTRKPSLHILNSPSAILWNSNKIYLDEIKNAGIVTTPRTLFLSASQPMDFIKFALTSRPTTDPVVVKPSVSSSGLSMRLIQNPQDLTEQDEDFLSHVSRQPNLGSIMVQDFVPEVSTTGEYSLVFVGGKFRHAYNKMPSPNDFRANIEFGATYTAIEDHAVPQIALRSAENLLKYVESEVPHVMKSSSGKGLAYARVDGTISKYGDFILGEIELIEPALGLGGPRGLEALQALCDIILGQPES